MSSFFNKTPYTDFHELNLDWLLERVNNIKDHVKGMQDDIIYLQEHTPDMDDYYDKTETDALLADKADVSDLPDMTDYYDKTETDALLADKADVSSLATVATTGDYDDLINKPTIPAAQVNSDWNANSGMAQILNKPTLATVATSGSYNDLNDTPNLYPSIVELLSVSSVSTSETDYYLTESRQNYRFLLFTGSWLNGTISTTLLVPNSVNMDIFYVYLNNNPANAYYRVNSMDSTTRIRAYSSNTNVTMRIYGIK